jgi:hypothetical protein
MGRAHRVRMIAGEHRAGAEVHSAEVHSIGDQHQAPVAVSLCLAVDLTWGGNVTGPAGSTLGERDKST